MLIGLAQRAANQNRTPLVTPRDLQVGNCRRTLTSIELFPASAVAKRAPQCQKHPCENSVHGCIPRLTSELTERGDYQQPSIKNKLRNRLSALRSNDLLDDVHIPPARSHRNAK